MADNDQTKNGQRKIKVNINKWTESQKLPTKK